MQKLFKKKKTDRTNTFKNEEKKNEEYKESQIITINIFGFTFNTKNHILQENLIWKNLVHNITFYLNFLCVAGYWKRSNDTSKHIWIGISARTPWSLTRNVRKSV